MMYMLAFFLVVLFANLESIEYECINCMEQEY